MLNDRKLLLLRGLSLILISLTLLSQIMFIIATFFGMFIKQEVAQVGFILAQIILILLNFVMLEEV